MAEACIQHKVVCSHTDSAVKHLVNVCLSETKATSCPGGPEKGPGLTYLWFRALFQIIVNNEKQNPRHEHRLSTANESDGER